MKTFFGIIGGLVLLGLIAVLVLVFWPLNRTTAEQLTLSDSAMAWADPADSENPRAAEITADCVACHTAEGGKDYVGGRAFETPMGTIYSNNITPDPETGIGNYTLDQFRAALVDGVAADGHQLYPAMPSANYRNLAERDIEAIYSYLMNEIEPVQAENKAADMMFPFNLRFGLRAWKWLAMPEPGFDASGDPELARGAYLVEGPAHCGACHTPRNLLYVQKAYSGSDDAFLSGGTLEGWTVPSLRGEDAAPAKWSAEDLKTFLATGRNSHSATTGEMTEVIEHSLQYLPDSDLDAMVAYLRQLAPNGGGVAEPEAASKSTRAQSLWDAVAQDDTAALLATADPEKIGEGGRLYLDNCSACHMIDGKGGDGVFPELDGNATVNAASPKGLITTILNGAELPSTEGAPLRLAMPAFKNRLNDAEVAEIASFLRGAWTNDSEAVATDDVKDIR